MKKWMILSLLMGTTLNAYTQKQDYVWLFGYDYSDTPQSEGIRFRFEDSLVISSEQRPMEIWDSYASICDSAGNLILYTNGCYTETANGIEVENSEGLNPGLLYNLFCIDGHGYTLAQNIIILQDQENPLLYHLFHYPNSIGSINKNLLHTLVDMSANGGNGQALFKNVPVVTDTIHNDGLHAVKHANGRDWWIIAAKKHSNVYFILLFSSQGISVHQQAIGNVAVNGITYGELVFSPDGSKLARFNPQDDLQVFDFDRCTGELSNPLYVPIQDDADEEYFGGLAWSADGRYLYAAEVKRLLQFDTWSDDLAASMVIVAEVEPPVCFLSGTIGYMELGPDGMIYSRPLNGQNCMHRIKHPERGGMACEFEQNYYQLEFPYANMPQFPNFRLGPIDGSPCDTLGLDNHPLAGWRYDRTGGLGVDFTSVSWYEPTEWQWDFADLVTGGANNSAERNPSHTFSAPGAYEVCLTVSNPYGSDTKCKTVWVTATGVAPAPSKDDGVVLWPNPTTGVLHWKGLPEAALVTVDVFNTLGQPVLHEVVRENRLALEALPNGLYRVRLQSAGMAPFMQSILLQRY